MEKGIDVIFTIARFTIINIDGKKFTHIEILCAETVFQSFSRDFRKTSENWQD